MRTSPGHAPTDRIHIFKFKQNENEFTAKKYWKRHKVHSSRIASDAVLLAPVPPKRCHKSIFFLYAIKCAQMARLSQNTINHMESVWTRNRNFYAEVRIARCDAVNERASDAGTEDKKSFGKRNK